MGRMRHLGKDLVKMNRRIPLPKITECVHGKASEGGIAWGQLLRACYPFCVVAILCLAHVHLRFARVDMLMQTSHLQVEHRALQRQLALAERESQAIDFEQLKIRGRRQLSMQVIENPTKNLLAKIPVSVQQKYQRPLEADGADKMVAQIRSERRMPEKGVKDVLLSVVESGRAVASVATERK